MFPHWFYLHLWGMESRREDFLQIFAGLELIHLKFFLGELLELGGTAKLVSCSASIWNVFSIFRHFQVGE